MMAAALLALGLGQAVKAGDNPVVVELYTSQGCSSCPPADAILHDLGKDRDIIALALHVDYWDYIGWKDEFADPAFTQRQRNYARAAQARTIYTPQMVIGGVDHVIGNRPAEVAATVSAHKELKDVANIDVNRRGRDITVTLTSEGNLRGPMVVQLVEYEPRQTVSIKRGENAGRTLDYANVVTRWETVGKWNGQFRKRVTATLSSERPAAVILQRDGHRAIVAAAHVE